jgi:hypothetical protein
VAQLSPLVPSLITKEPCLSIQNGLEIFSFVADQLVKLNEIDAVR